MKLNTLRPRRLRRTEAIRSMVRENSLELNDFVYPIFVVPGTNVKEEIPSMPGQYHLSVDNAVKVAEEIYKMGIPAVEVFGLPEYKDDIGSSAWDMKSPVQRAIRAIKEAVPDLVIVGDVCLCQYTKSGHCGVLKGHEVDNDPTLELIAKVALSQAECGADIIMVKPALAYLDIVRQVRNHINRPVATYNVSGEYAMVKAAAAKGWIDEKRIVMESLLCMKRAGADIIISYHAPDVAKWMKEEAGK